MDDHYEKNHLSRSIFNKKKQRKKIREKEILLLIIYTNITNFFNIPNKF